MNNKNQVNCYSCGINYNEYYAEENGFTLVKCKNCGLLYVDKPPSLSEIKNAHIQGIHRGKMNLNVTGRYKKSKIKNYLKVLNDLYDQDSIKEKDEWLDVGCGYGEFLESLNLFTNYKVVTSGSEPNIYKQKSAQKRKLNVTYFDLNNNKNKFNYISLLNVYSHLPNPIEYLQNVKNKLKENGEIIIETGDTADLNAKDHYRPFYLPDHLSFTSEKIITDMLFKIGFNILKVKKYPFFQITPINLIIEFTKIFIPNQKSLLLTNILRKQKWKNTDMFVRAQKN